jgi:hypothetical protein
MSSDVALNRIDAAKATYAQALERKLTNPYWNRPVSNRIFAERSGGDGAKAKRNVASRENIPVGTEIHSDALRSASSGWSGIRTRSPRLLTIRKSTSVAC